jgi:hypothetical protein
MEKNCKSCTTLSNVREKLRLSQRKVIVKTNQVVKLRQALARYRLFVETQGLQPLYREWLYTEVANSEDRLFE